MYHNPPRMIRTSKQTKNDIKTIYEYDENLFWGELSHSHKSLTGFIKHKFNLSRNKIKKCHQALEGQRGAQVVFNKWITGDLFKSTRNGNPHVPFCTYCDTERNTLEHFISCTGLDILTLKDNSNTDKWKEICTEYVKHYYNLLYIL